MENELENDTLTNETENDTLTNEPLEESEELKALQEENQKLKEENEKVKKDFQTASAQKEHFREKFEKIQPKEPREPKENPTPVDATNPLEMVKLAKAFSDYDADEIEFITNHAKSSKTEDLLKSANDEWVKRAIKAHREEIEKEKKIPSSSSPGSTVGMKSPQEAFKLATDKRITDEKIEELTKKAFEENKKSGGKSGA